MEWELIPKSKFKKFHRIFKGDSQEIFKVCLKCGGICEYSFIATLLPGELEFMANEMKISINEFRNRYLDGIICNGVIMDVGDAIPEAPPTFGGIADYSWRFSLFYWGDIGSGGEYSHERPSQQLHK